MARPASLQAQRAAANVASLPAPVGGWNARDSIANMEPLDAVTLINLFPSTSNVVLRGGSNTSYATGFSGNVQTLMAYNGGATSKLFAADDVANKIYDVSSTGAIGAAVYSSITNAFLQYANISTSGGNYLVAVNGHDDLILYDGTTWANINGGTTPNITGVTTANLINVLLFKNRLWFIEKNTLKAWYLPTQSISGAAQMFDLRSIARKGGYLVDMATWTIDAGYGVDDNLVFITSKGEVIIYAGTDPASSSTFSLIGVWQLGAPLGNRCTLKYGGDLVILTLDGLVPMAQGLQSSRLDPRVNLSDKIQGAISLATSTYQGNTGWQLLYYPKKNALWVNVPVGAGQQQQYVMNTITKSWCQFQNWSANCWALYNDEPYFGGNKFVGQAWTTTYEDDSSNIQTQALQAFNYFGSRGVIKYFTRVRTSLFSNGVPSISVGMNVDFNIYNNVTPILYTPNTPARWGVSKWGSGMWGQALQIVNTWSGVSGIGYCGALEFRSASSGLQIEWSSSDVVYQAGWGGI